MGLYTKYMALQFCVFANIQKARINTYFRNVRLNYIHFQNVCGIFCYNFNQVSATPGLVGVALYTSSTCKCSLPT